MLSARLSNSMRKAIYRRDGYRCALCDSTYALQVHHYIARGKGGTNSPHNLITLCGHCHARVHGAPFDDAPISAEEMEQAVLEYLADYYAEEGHNPWKRE